VTPLNIKRLLPKRRTKNKGQGITEFALILPILLLVILGIIEAGWLIWAYITVQNAAREAARYAVTGAPLDDSGNPWVGDPIDDRLPAIVQVARDSARGLPIDQHADYVQNVEEGGAAFGAGFECEGISTYYDCYANTRRALGVMVRGQVPNEDTVADTTDVKVENNNPGERGLNVEVEVYYNAVMLDPIYAALMGNGSFRLTGRVVLQNEGLNLALGDVLPPQSTPVENVAGGGGTGSTGDDPYILVNLPLDGDAELPEEGQVPAGTPIDIALNLHPFESHYVCFGPSNVVPGSPFNVLGDVYLLPGSYVIPENIPARRLHNPLGPAG
jgi:hypothetical protein